MAGNLPSSDPQGGKSVSEASGLSAAGATSCGAAQPGAHAAPGVGSRVKAALEELWIAAFGWIPTPVGIALRLLAWRWLFKSCGSARFATGLSLAGCGNMRLGNGVRMGRGCFVTAAMASLCCTTMWPFRPTYMLAQMRAA